MDAPAAAPPSPTVRLRRAAGLALSWLPGALLATLALWQVVALYHLFWARVGYPLDLEWMESGMLVHAKRVADGQALYGPPTVDFASFCYPPLYPAVLGVLGKVFGLSYVVGRALSILAFTATLSLIGHAAARAAGPTRDGVWQAPGPRAQVEAWIAAAVAAGVIAASFPFTGAWFDLVRNDSLFLALVVGGLYALQRGLDRPGLLVLSGALLGLAVFAKQTAVFPILAAGAALLVLRPRRVWILVVTTTLVAGGGTLLLQWATEGWFWFYVFDLHQSHLTLPDEIWPKTPRLLWQHGRWLYLGAGLAALAVPAASAALRRAAPASVVWGLGALSGLVAAAVGKGTQWSESNAFIPGFVLPAAFVAVAVSELRGLAASRAGQTAVTRTPGRAAATSAMLALPLVLSAGYLLAHPPAPRRVHAPSARQWQAARRLIAHLHALGRDGEVLVPYHPWYSVLAGGPGHGHIMNVNDVAFTRPLTPGERGRLGDPHRRRARVLAARADLLRSYREALGSGRFAHVLHDRDLVARWLPRGAAVTALPAGAYTAQLPGLWGAYRLEADLAWDGAVAPTLAGNPSGARWRWRRIAEARRPAGARVVFDLEGRNHAGWEVEGEAWGPGPVDSVLWDPIRRRPQGLVSGAAGRRWASSFHGGDATVGRLRSPPFVIDRPTLTLRVGGGRQPGVLEVRLVVDGQVTHRTTGAGREVLTEVRWDVRRLQGRTARLEAVDDATGPWGHLLFDEVLFEP